MAEALPAVAASLIPLDPSLLLAISFAKGRGSYCHQALTLARNADHFVEENDMVCCTFTRSLEGATRALALLDFIGQTRGCHIYTGSPMLWGSGRVRGVLRCYLGGLNCGNPENWCFVHQGGVLEYMAGLPIRKLPCKKIVGYYAGRQLTWKETSGEFEAAAIEAGVEWCPYWKQTAALISAAP